jgi:hypothetical protein
VNQAGPTGGPESIGNVSHDPDRLRWVHLADNIEPFPETLAGDMVHDVEKDAGCLTGRVYADDVGMAQPGDHSRFGQKTLGDRAMDRKIGVHDLDRDRPIEGGIPGKKDHPHPAPTELSLDPVLGPQGGLKPSYEFLGLNSHGSSCEPPSGRELDHSN